MLMAIRRKGVNMGGLLGKEFGNAEPDDQV